MSETSDTFGVGEGASEAAVTIAALTAERLSARFGVAASRPRLLALDVDADDTEWATLELRFELAPGVVMDTALEGEIFRQEFDADQDRAAHWFGAEAERAWEHRAWLTEAAASIRDAAEAFAAGLIAQGIPARVARLSVDTHENWIRPEEAGWHLEIETLGHQPGPAALHAYVTRPEDVVLELGRRGAELADLRDAKAGLAREGADGRIDEITLNALGQAGTVRDALSLAVSNGAELIRLRPDLTLCWRLGRLYSRGQSGSRLRWGGSTVTIDGVNVPEHVGLNAVARPVTAFSDKPPLDDRMVIEEVVNWTSDDEAGLDLRLDMPTYLFEASTGRVWPG